MSGYAENLSRRVLNPRLPRFALLMVYLLLLVGSANAQSLLLGVVPSTTSVLVSNPVTLTIGLTNFTGLAANATVSSTFSLPVQVTGAQFTLNQGFTATNSDGQGVTFTIPQFQPNDRAVMTVTVIPTSSGALDATVLASSGLPSNSVVTVTIQVSAPSADLGVSVVGPAGPVLVNDWVNYQVTANNRSPADIPGVVLTNTLPAGAQLISLSPTSDYIQANGLVLVSLGTLTNGASRTFTLQVQPTVATTNATFTASIGAAGIQDTNVANNVASSTISVGNFLSANLIATNASTMAFDPQSGLMKQTVRVWNNSTAAVDSVRLSVSGLTNWLRNAVGTNNGNPFVVYGASLATNQSIDLVLEYFVPSRTTISVLDSAYTAVGVPTNNPAIPSGTPTDVARKISLDSGYILIEFPATPGRSYTILYSDNASFTNAMAAQPGIVAQADRVQWLDDGPPKTISVPASASSRFYRVVLNP